MANLVFIEIPQTNGHSHDCGMGAIDCGKMSGLAYDVLFRYFEITGAEIVRLWL